MIDQGISRNAVYNINIAGIPDIKKSVFSSAISKNDPGI
jgi:hypothetical protein